jgi:hypothetical protein
VAERGGVVKSKQGVGVVADYTFDDCPPLDILLVPGSFPYAKELLIIHTSDFLLRNPGSMK